MSKTEKKGIIANASALLNRALLAARAGMQFGGKRDLYTVYGYNKNIQYMDYLARYQRGDIAKRIVDAKPLATWSNPPKVLGSDEFNKAWETFVNENNVWAWLLRADILAGIGHYGALLLGVDDPDKLEAPVRRAKKLLYLQPYSEQALNVAHWNRDPKSERFAMPETYTLQPAQSPDSGLLGSKPVETSISTHWSRIIHIAEGALEDELVGTPRLECVYNLFDDLAKVVGGTAETYWLISNRGMQVDVDKEMSLSEGDAAALSEEIEEFQHQLRRYIRTRGVTIKNLGAETPDPKNVFDMLISLVSGTTGIPKRILIGSEAGQLASDQDRANWAERIHERRETFAAPFILRPFITRLQSFGVLPQSSFKIVWPEAMILNPLERAQQSAQNARSAINMAKALNENPMLMTLNEGRELLGLPPTQTPTTPEPENSLET